MLTRRDIKTIDCGSRQLTLEFDSVTQEEKDIWVMTSFKEHIVTHGHILLTDFISCVVEKHGLTVQEILQSVFWAANELKLHFLIDDFIVSPYKAKNVLLNAPSEIIFLIDSLKVKDSLFHDAVAFYRELMPDKFIENKQEEQYNFAGILRTIFKNWETGLKYLELRAQQTSFPGIQTIEKHLQFLKNIIAHQDTASIIKNAYNKTDIEQTYIGEI